MTDLEFIEKEIGYWTDEVNEYKKMIVEDEIVLNYCQLAIDKQRLKHAETRLHHLQQIKTNLEAWEVVKKHCDYQDGDRFNCIPEGFYIIEPIRGKDFLIVRKALEVE